MCLFPYCAWAIARQGDDVIFDQLQATLNPNEPPVNPGRNEHRRSVLALLTDEIADADAEIQEELNFVREHRRSVVEQTG
jgi:hypothetical protein